MAIYLGTHSLGRREYPDLSRTFGHRICVEIDTQEAEESIWSQWLSLVHSGPTGSTDSPNGHLDS